jgi:DNA phosphorothioation-dependent restriction protein DptH
VDLDFFSEKEANSDLLIIHYSDQYTSSSGYDAITVTHKSKQYSKVIQEYLKEKGIDAGLQDVAKIINLFNAVNGDWLLRLVSSKKMIGVHKDTTFSREKISIVAAIKFMLAFLRHPDIVWVPISLEELLRVSGGAGLSSAEGILSYKNLGFEKGPTSDDLLFIGLNYVSDQAKIYLYPTEVKTGINAADVIKKAFVQVSATATGLQEAMNPADNKPNTIMYKVNRNFLMQLLITSCKKMQVYHVDDSQNWNVILDKFRLALLNEDYTISTEIQEVLGRGSVLSFRQALVSRKTSFKEDTINFIEMPENDEFDLILSSVDEIHDDILNKRDNNLLIFEECKVNQLTGDLTGINATEFEGTGDETEKTLEENVDHGETNNTENEQFEDKTDVKVESQELGMKILFGKNQQDGSDVIWEPNNTDVLFHTNTGIIGTMGTGKTQFTKSLITQLYLNQKKNVGEESLGILIFDYKGDYNESKTDFVETTNATIYKPYALPINPLAITETSVFKPLLPVHTANTFRDTIAKIYGLGPKQKATLTNCIMDTYEACGIRKADIASWKNKAPTFDQVYQRYSNDEEIKKGDSLSAAMDELAQYDVFEKDPSKTKSLFDVLKGVVVVDLSGYPTTLQNLIIAIMLDLFYTQMQSVGSSKLEGKYRQLTKFILVDEADNFMSQDFPSLKKILKEGREFGVGTILSTQFLKHFGSGDDDYAKYILTWIVHNVADLKPSDVDFVFKTESKSTESQMLFNDIKKLQKHYSIVKISSEKPQYIKDRAFWELYSDLKSN